MTVRLTRRCAAALLTAVVFVAPVTAQEAPPRQPSVEPPAEVARVLRDYESAWEAGDAAGLAALFTADGFANSAADWVRGTAAIRQEYQRAGGPLVLRALAWATDGDTGWIVGAYGYGPTAATRDNGKFILALRRVDGRWLIAADLDNTNRQPGGG